MFTLLCALVVSTLALTNAEELTIKLPNKKTFYVCPPDFMRLGNKCYYFSNSSATWQDAYFQCKDLHSNLAIIKSAHQNKILRVALNKESVEPHERWVGGYYDWQQKEWKWAPNGKPMHFQGFSQMDPESTEKMDWQKAILDPRLQYKWSARSAFERKHYICQTNLKNVDYKRKKKLQKVYNTNKYKKLNEVPVPDIYDPHVHLPNDIDPNSPVQNALPAYPPEVEFEANVIGTANFAKRTKEEKIRRKRIREERKRHREEKRKEKEAKKHKRNHEKQLIKNQKVNRTLKNSKESTRNFDKSTEIPLRPKKIVEDFSDLKLNLVPTVLANESAKRS